MPYDPQHLNLSTLKVRKKVEDLIETYKILNGNYAEVLNIPNFLFQISTQPNALEEETVKVPAMNSFKICLDANLNSINLSTYL